MIEESGILKIDNNDIYKFIFLIINPYKDYPDSSQRYFLEINDKYDITPLEAHLMFIDSIEPPEFEVSFERELNYVIYNYVEEKLRSV